MDGGIMTKIIAFSGADGSGKSTVINQLKERIERSGQIVKTMDAMQPCRYNKVLRKVSSAKGLNQFDLFGGTVPNIIYAADLHYNLINYLNPLVDTCDYILVHRYDLCCFAYSMLSNCNMEVMKSILKSIKKPDYHFYLHIDINEMLHRIEIRGEEKSEKENKATLSRVLSNYQLLLASDFQQVEQIENNDMESTISTIIEKIGLNDENL
jgi:dTMP kinase